MEDIFNKKHDNILLITNFGLDGIVSQILLEKYLNNIVTINLRYRDYETYLSKLNTKDFDYIFLVNVDTRNETILNDKKVINIQQTEFKDNFNNIERKLFFNNDKSSSRVILELIEQFQKKKLTKYKKFIDLVDDFCLYRFERIQSEVLDYILFNKGREFFIKTFWNLDHKISLDLIEDYEKELWRRNNVYDTRVEISENDSSIGVVFLEEFHESLVRKIFNETGYKILFYIFKDYIFIRTVLKEVDLGKDLKNLKLGSGKKQVASIRIKNKNEMMHNLKKMEEYFLEKYKEKLNV